MASKRRLPAKKHPVCGDSDDSSIGSSVSSSASSASFNMEEDSSDEELDDKAFQVKPMNSQETNLTAPSQLCTQPDARPRKKRKVSVSPQDSLAQKARLKSPPSIIMMEGTSYKQAIPLLNLDDSHPTKPNSKPAATLPSKPSPASRVHAAISEASKEATSAKRAKKMLPKKQSYDEENEITASTVVAPTEKSNAKAKKAQASRQSIAESKASESKTAVSRKTSPAKTAPKSKKSPVKTAPKSKAPSAKTTPKSKASAGQGSLAIAIETPDVKAVAKHKDTSAKKKTKIEEKKTASKAELKPKAESIKKKKKKKTFQEQLLHHVFFSGRPHTVKDLTQHLKTSEASVKFCLLSLVDKGWIIKKEFTSKSRSRELYWANDDSKNKELMAALDMVAPREVAEARVKLATLQQQEKATVMELHQVMQEPSNEELNERVANAEHEVASLQAEVHAILKRISAGEQTVVPNQKLGLVQPKVSKARSNPKRIKVEINRMRGVWKKRKEKCNDFIECLADGMEKKAKVVIKMLELETDEDAGVKMPRSYEIK